MLRFFVIAFLALGPAAAASAADELVVGTFNCEFLLPAKVHVKYGLPFELEPDDQRAWAEPGYRDAQYAKAVAAVAGFLATLDADVLVLTEVGSRAEVEPLVGELSRLGQAYPHWDVGDSADEVTGQHVAVLSRRPITTVRHGGRAIIPGRETYDVELDDVDAEVITGIEKGLHVTFTAGGRPVHLIGLHLKSERGGHEADAKRIAQASIVRRYTLPLLKRGERVIVAGDLNDHRGQPSMRRIRGRDDVHEDLYQTGSPLFFEGRFRELAYRWTYTYQGVRTQVDHVLLSPSIFDACGLESIEPIFPLQRDSFVSDHRPVLVRLAFPEDAAGAAAGSDHPALSATAWVQTSAEYRFVTESIFDRAAGDLRRLATDPRALADPDHPPAGAGAGPERVAVVLDIDQTILDDSPYAARLVKSGRWHDQSREDEWLDWCRQAAAPAVPGAVGFIEAVRDVDEQLDGVELRVFLISNRHVSIEDVTVANLRGVGVELDPDDVLMLEERDGWDRDKSSRRAYLAGLGYRIAMLVGDDLNDLRPARGLDPEARLALCRAHRGLAERGLWVLVPNPLFGSWLRAAAEGGDPAEPLSHRLGHRLETLRR